MPYIKVKQLKDLQETPAEQPLMRNLLLMDGYKLKLTCKVCSETYFGASTAPSAREFARVHQNIHSQKCPICPKRYLRKESLLAHLSDSHRGDCFFCDHCPHAVRDKRVLIKHMQHKHSKLINKNNTSGKCKTLKQLRNRQVVVYQNRLPQMPDTSMKRLRNRDVVAREENFLCQDCGYVTKDKAKLDYHAGRYHKQQKYPCKKCKKVLLTQEGFEKHVESHKLPPKTYTCDKCGKTFAGAWNLRKHILSHSGVKPQQCTICKGRFSSRSSLRQHLLTHTGKRPYECDICGKTFVQKPALTGHRRQHGGKLPPMPKVYIDSFIKEVAPSAISHLSKTPGEHKDDEVNFEDFNVEH
ncbi:zinc finger protein 26-like [Diachasmimorpha longicaudata]|uniref:zinc finger protein 26-like n=1 Tax=Diachasmimorpha longicaudata TaxID=58733 RepID=UPI0030B8FC2C